jgi:hypothetical protein
MKSSTPAMKAATTTELHPARRCSHEIEPVSASERNENKPLITNAPTTAPHRLREPPTTSIASVKKVKSR